VVFTTMPTLLRNDQQASLRLVGITKSYGPSRVLDKVHLSVASGEVVALMGANGAGKSTLAKIASGALSPDSGQITVGGNEVRFQSPRAARKRGVVVVHQSTNQLGAAGLSVAENLLLDGLCEGTIGVLVGHREMQRRAKAIAALVDLDLPLERDFGELGPAHRQLIAIARAVQANASVLILDEPTASLAAAEAARLFSIVDRLRARGVGILYISHRLEDIRRLADRIVVLRNGRVVAEQAQPLDLSAAIQAMIGRDLDAVAPRYRISEAETVLRLRQVRLLPSAKPFDLSVRKAEVVAVTGALGSGKSRLLGAIFGLSRAVDGEMLLDDRPWRPRKPAEAISGGVFMAGEDRWRTSLFPAVTPGADISGTIALPHRHSWFPFGLMNDGREESAAKELIRALQIRCRSCRDTLDLLSGGNQQKVVVARWQAAACRLLLLDEPFQGIDVGARHDLIFALRSGSRNSATLIATSDVEEALEVADKVAVMRDHAITGLYDLRLGESTSLLKAISAVERSETEMEASV
jgi:simple sugar transport system ATP-binding protein